MIMSVSIRGPKRFVAGFWRRERVLSRVLQNTELQQSNLAEHRHAQQKVLRRKLRGPKMAELARTVNQAMASHPPQHPRTEALSRCSARVQCSAVGPGGMHLVQCSHCLRACWSLIGLYGSSIRGLDEMQQRNHNACVSSLHQFYLKLSKFPSSRCSN